MIKIALVGKGAVSKNLMRAFQNTEGVDVLEVLPSRAEALEKALIKTTRIAEGKYETEQPDVYIIAVRDDAISLVSKHFEKSEKLIVHTSGCISMNALPENVRRGVFYPLQTFSKERKVDFKNVPICIEAEKREDLDLLGNLGASISESVHKISSEQRKSIHLAAVFVNNFTNHIYHIGDEICKENKVSFEILKPLIRETIEKLDVLYPIDAQTGPAKRHDGLTIKRHLEQLSNKTHKEVYRTLTRSIKETYQNRQ